MQIRDDRGKIFEARPGAQGGVRAGLQRLEGLLLVVAFTVTGLVSMAVVLVCGMALSQSGPAFRRWGEILGFSSLVVGPLVGATLGVFFSRRTRRDPGPAKRCRACGYSLAELPQEADGCRVCPECGAAWWASVGEAGDAAATRGERM